MSDRLTAEERQIALALMGCPESRLYRGGERPSLAEVGALLGISRQRVQQIEVRALRRLRTLMLHDPAAARLVRKLYSLIKEN